MGAKRKTPAKVVASTPKADEPGATAMGSEAAIVEPGALGGSGLAAIVLQHEPVVDAVKLGAKTRLGGKRKTQDLAVDTMDDGVGTAKEPRAKRRGKGNGKNLPVVAAVNAVAGNDGNVGSNVPDSNQRKENEGAVMGTFGTTENIFKSFNYAEAENISTVLFALAEGANTYVTAAEITAGRKLQVGDHFVFVVKDLMCLWRVDELLDAGLVATCAAVVENGDDFSAEELEQLADVILGESIFIMAAGEEQTLPSLVKIRKVGCSRVASIAATGRLDGAVKTVHVSDRFSETFDVKPGAVIGRNDCDRAFCVSKLSFLSEQLRQVRADEIEGDSFAVICTVDTLFVVATAGARGDSGDVRFPNTVVGTVVAALPSEVPFSEQFMPIYDPRKLLLGHGVFMESSCVLGVANPHTIAAALAYSIIHAGEDSSHYTSSLVESLDKVKADGTGASGKDPNLVEIMYTNRKKHQDGEPEMLSEPTTRELAMFEKEHPIRHAAMLAAKSNVRVKGTRNKLTKREVNNPESESEDVDLDKGSSDNGSKNCQTSRLGATASTGRTKARKSATKNVDRQVADYEEVQEANRVRDEPPKGKKVRDKESDAKMAKQLLFKTHRLRHDTLLEVLPKGLDALRQERARREASEAYKAIGAENIAKSKARKEKRTAEAASLLAEKIRDRKVVINQKKEVIRRVAERRSEKIQERRKKAASNPGNDAFNQETGTKQADYIDRIGRSAYDRNARRAQLTLDQKLQESEHARKRRDLGELLDEAMVGKGTKAEKRSSELLKLITAEKKAHDKAIRTIKTKFEDILDEELMDREYAREQAALLVVECCVNEDGEDSRIGWRDEGKFRKKAWKTRDSEQQEHTDGRESNVDDDNEDEGGGSGDTPFVRDIGDWALGGYGSSSRSSLSGGYGATNMGSSLQESANSNQVNYSGGTRGRIMGGSGRGGAVDDDDGRDSDESEDHRAGKDKRKTDKKEKGTKAPSMVIAEDHRSADWIVRKVGKHVVTYDETIGIMGRASGDLLRAHAANTSLIMVDPLGFEVKDIMAKEATVGMKGKNTLIAAGISAAIINGVSVAATAVAPLIFPDLYARVVASFGIVMTSDVFTQLLISPARLASASELGVFQRESVMSMFAPISIVYPEGGEAHRDRKDEYDDCISREDMAKFSKMAARDVDRMHIEDDRNFRIMCVTMVQVLSDALAIRFRIQDLLLRLALRAAEVVVGLELGIGSQSKWAMAIAFDGLLRDITGVIRSCLLHNGLQRDIAARDKYLDKTRPTKTWASRLAKQIDVINWEKRDDDESYEINKNGSLVVSVGVVSAHTPVVSRNGTSQGATPITMTSGSYIRPCRTQFSTTGCAFAKFEGGCKFSHGNAIPARNSEEWKDTLETIMRTKSLEPTLAFMQGAAIPRRQQAGL